MFWKGWFAVNPVQFPNKNIKISPNCFDSYCLFWYWQTLSFIYLWGNLGQLLWCFEQDNSPPIRFSFLDKLPSSQYKCHCFDSYCLFWYNLADSCFGIGRFSPLYTFKAFLANFCDVLNRIIRRQSGSVSWTNDHHLHKNVTQLFWQSVLFWY